MLSLVMFGDMNRSEQESLYRTSRKLSLVPVNHSTVCERRTSCTRICCPDAQPKCRDRPHADLVLSVLKSPLNHGGGEFADTNCDVPAASREDDDDNDTPDEDAR